MAKSPNKIRKKWKDLPLIARVGIVLGGAYVTYKVVEGEIGDSDSRIMLVNKANLTPMVEDNISTFATELHRVMDAWPVPIDRGQVWKYTAALLLTDDDWKYLNNYWTRNIDTQDHSIYEWVNDEAAITPLESEAQRAILNKMAAAGLDY